VTVTVPVERVCTSPAAVARSAHRYSPAVSAAETVAGSVTVQRAPSSVAVTLASSVPSVRTTCHTSPHVGGDTNPSAVVAGACVNETVVPASNVAGGVVGSIICTHHRHTPRTRWDDY
jgi:hypothetical protein